MKVAFVVQRYGLEVNGGAELLCRQVAERMVRFWDVEVLTTCAVDYMTWKNEYAPGLSTVNGVSVRRFQVDTPRDVRAFNKLSERVFFSPGTRAEEIEWMRAQGPCSSPFLDYLSQHAADYDFFLFFTYLYGTTFFGLPLVNGKAGLVPTAHDEPPIFLDIFRNLFKLPQVLLFNTPWEQQFVNQRFGTAHILQDVVGVGVEVPGNVDGDRFRARHEEALEGRDFLLYAGRVDESKGCRELISHFARLREDLYEHPLKLVLIGTPVMELPEHPDIVPLGFVTEEEKFDALAAATVVILPSPYESLSIVALEAWALGQPVLANGRCETLRMQCAKSNGGLWYEDYLEFRATLELLLRQPALRKCLGASGRQFVKDTYTWEIVEAKYRSLLDRALSSARSP
ncbi:MAG: glycosyltransferase family 4 protein [Dehalococcoidia bacterium]